MKAIPTIYRGVEFKSRLEANTAAFFDQHGIAWQYEPQSFLLEPGLHYWPDFWLPEIYTWVECKGVMDPKSKAQTNGFVAQITSGQLKQPDHKFGPDFLLIGPISCTIWEDRDRDFGVDYGMDAHLATCCACEKSFFMGYEGSYQCRFCGEWDGDHHLHHPNGILKLQLEKGVVIGVY